MTAYEIERIDTGQRFSSITAAARAIGVKPQTLNFAIAHDKPCRGIEFRKLKPRTNWIKVRCIETGEEFDSVAMAANRFFINPNSIYRALQEDRGTCGLHFERIDRHGEGRAPDL